MQETLNAAMRTTLVGVVLNLFLALIKVTTGVVGHSYALIADGIESTADIFSSLVTYTGLRIASNPPDDCHPYGHGKAESLAGLVVALALLGAAGLIAYQAVQEIRSSHTPPEWFTLPVLVLVVISKLVLSRVVERRGRALGSVAVKGDAWHHMSDALTSLAAFVGISLALIGGEGWESADDWAALAACGVIVFNGARLARTALHEVMDGSVEPEFVEHMRLLAGEVEGVHEIEKVRVRKSGVAYLMDIHVHVDGNLSVTRGHEIGGAVKTHLMRTDARVKDVVVHVEPADDTPPRAGN